MELQWLLRGFSEMNEKPQLYVSPESMINNARDNFFKAVGSIPFVIWGDERDLDFKEKFEHDFLEYFYMKEIGFQTPDAFILTLGSFLRRKLPVYCQHWRKILDEMYITQTGHVTGNVEGNTKNASSRDTGSKSRSQNHSETDSNTTSKSVSRAGVSDTPQNNLDINLDDIAYASNVNKSDSNSESNATTKSDSENHSGDYTVSVGSEKGNAVTDSVSDNYGRSKDVFDIYNEWITSGYDLFTPLFKDAVNEQIFVVFN